MQRREEEGKTLMAVDGPLDEVLRRSLLQFWGVGRHDIEDWYANIDASRSLSPTSREFYRREVAHYASEEDIRMRRYVTRDQATLFEQFQVPPPDDRVDRVSGASLCLPEDMYGTDVRGARCSKCSSVDTLLTAVQTRSTDEPTSYFVQCCRCNHRWRMC